MDTEISISNPITRKLLENEILLDEITLSSFCEGLKVYSSCEEARCKGYEAHHIVPISEQIKNYNLLHNSNYTSGNRKKFLKEVKDIDDRCYRLTAFEHILIHFLMAKEDDSRIASFEAMVRHNWNKLISSEKETLSLLKDFSEMRVLGRNKVTEYVKNSLTVPKFKKGQIPWNKGKTYVSGWHHSEESKNRIREKNLGKKISDESRIKMSKSQKEFHNKMSDEERENYLNKKREISRRPSTREAIKRETYKAMNTPEMVDIRKRIKEDYEKQKLELGKNYVKWNQFQKMWFEQNNRGE